MEVRWLVRWFDEKSFVPSPFRSARENSDELMRLIREGVPAPVLLISEARKLAVIEFDNGVRVKIDKSEFAAFDPAWRPPAFDHYPAHIRADKEAMSRAVGFWWECYKASLLALKPEVEVRTEWVSPHEFVAQVQAVGIEDAWPQTVLFSARGRRYAVVACKAFIEREGLHYARR